jgi:hypothetical protein
VILLELKEQLRLEAQLLAVVPTMKLQNVPSIVSLPLLFLSAFLVRCLCPLSLMKLLLGPLYTIKQMPNGNYEQLVDRETKQTN